MICPNCNNRKPALKDSRDSGTRYRRRRYWCGECGERFTTREITVDTHEKLLRAEEWAVSTRQRIQSFWDE